MTAPIFRTLCHGDKDVQEGVDVVTGWVIGGAETVDFKTKSHFNDPHKIGFYGGY